MITYRDITAALTELGLRRDIPVIAHISISRMGSVRGGLNTVMGALLATVDNVMLPTFTYSTMIIPESGPEDNDLVYGTGHEANLEASVYAFDLPADREDSEAGEALRRYPHTFRSNHPFFSLTGLGLDAALVSHPADDPYAPVRALGELGGWVALMGAEAADIFSLHYAEQLAGRKQFTRWALTADGIQAVPHFPGCPNGFHKVFYYLQDELHRIQVGEREWFAMQLDVLLDTAIALIREDAFALLCNDLHCTRCNLVRDAIKAQYANHWRHEG